ncbi:unnamed protein product [Linum trigynum]|uniref:Uncharacterized protein n=1 Tax=Linum trigynum TaxID=586398 RepID=A0AAV2FGT9_9ROSI
MVSRVERVVEARLAREDDDGVCGGVGKAVAAAAFQSAIDREIDLERREGDGRWQVGVAIWTGTGLKTGNRTV